MIFDNGWRHAARDSVTARLCGARSPACATGIFQGMRCKAPDTINTSKGKTLVYRIYKRWGRELQNFESRCQLVGLNVWGIAMTGVVQAFEVSGLKEPITV